MATADHRLADGRELTMSDFYGMEAGAIPGFAEAGGG